MSFVIDGEYVLINDEVYNFITKQIDSSYNKASHWIITFIGERVVVS